MNLRDYINPDPEKRNRHLHVHGLNLFEDGENTVGTVNVVADVTNYSKRLKNALKAAGLEYATEINNIDGVRYMAYAFGGPTDKVMDFCNSYFEKLMRFKDGIFVKKVDSSV